LVQEISSASQEQTTGVDQIAKATTQLDSVIQQNASASEEMASMAEELSSQAEQLAKTISFFKVQGSGTETSARRLEHTVSIAHIGTKKAALPLPPAVENKKPRVSTALTLRKEPTDSGDEEFEEF